MIRILVYTKLGEIHSDWTLEQVQQNRASLIWYWIDFAQPTMQETYQLHQLGFHELAIQDCLHLQQRTKLDIYDDYRFYVLNAIDPITLQPNEIDLFQHEQYIVTFHFKPQPEIDFVWEKMSTDPTAQPLGSWFICYKIMDKITDSFFPIAEELEDQITEIGTRLQINGELNQLFQIRRNLLRLRYVVQSLRELIIRITQSDQLTGSKEEQRYYMDVYDLLARLSGMIDSNREMTSDIRDNYLSLNSHRMNSIMMTLTLFTTIFMPLTFIAGIYGMNFEHMPELHTRYGYFIVLGVMVVISIGMIIWFRHKGWFSKNEQ
jgi:magnesium transporter